MKLLVLSTTLALIFSLVCASPPKDKSLLYKTFPQLTSPETDPCTRALADLMIYSRTNTTQRVQMMESMAGIADLGSLPHCESDQGQGKYTTLTVNITHMPLMLI